MAAFSAVCCAAIGRCLFAGVHAVVAMNFCDSKTIVVEDAVTALMLGVAMEFEIAPCGDGCLIAPEGEGEHLAGFGEALESFDGDEAVDLSEMGLEIGGDVEIGFALAFGGPDFEDDSDH
jgi:hypothetical protein